MHKRQDRSEMTLNFRWGYIPNRTHVATLIWTDFPKFEQKSIKLRLLEALRDMARTSKKNLKKWKGWSEAVVMGKALTSPVNALQNTTIVADRADDDMGDASIWQLSISVPRGVCPLHMDHYVSDWYCCTDLLHEYRITSNIGTLMPSMTESVNAPAKRRQPGKTLRNSLTQNCQNRTQRDALCCRRKKVWPID